MSSRVLFYVYLGVLALTFLKGLLRYNRLDQATKILLLLIAVTTVSETICLVRNGRNLGNAPVYHVYNVIEIILTTAYFVKTIKLSHHVAFFWISFFVWPLLAVLNAIYLQPPHKFNSNILLLESITIIAMSLYALYKILLNDDIQYILKYPHFWIWSIQLFFWSSSFFFWGYYEVLFQKGWPHMKLFVYLQGVINVLVYLGIGITLLFYPKNLKTNEY